MSKQADSSVAFARSHGSYYASPAAYRLSPVAFSSFPTMDYSKSHLPPLYIIHYGLLYSLGIWLLFSHIASRIFHAQRQRGRCLWRKDTSPLNPHQKRGGVSISPPHPLTTQRKGPAGPLLWILPPGVTHPAARSEAERAETGAEANAFTTPGLHQKNQIAAAHSSKQSV